MGRLSNPERNSGKWPCWRAGRGFLKCKSRSTIKNGLRLQLCQKIRLNAWLDRSNDIVAQSLRSKPVSPARDLLLWRILRLLLRIVLRRRRWALVGIGRLLVIRQRHHQPALGLGILRCRLRFLRSCWLLRRAIVLHWRRGALVGIGRL